MNDKDNFTTNAGNSTFGYRVLTHIFKSIHIAILEVLNLYNSFHLLNFVYCLV